MNTCPTGKNAYPDRAAANRALFLARKQHAKERTIEKRVYRCPLCWDYHLSHLSPRNPKRRAA